MREKKLIKTFLFINILTIISIIVGMQTVSIIHRNTLPTNTQVGGIDIGGITKEEVSRKIKGPVQNKLFNESFLIKFDKKLYPVKYSEIDATVNVEETLNRIYSRNIPSSLKNFVDGVFFGIGKKIDPVIKLKKEAFKKGLEVELSEINRKSINADITIENESIVIYAEQKGYSLNIDKVMNTVNNKISSNYISTIELKTGDDLDVTPLQPQFSTEDIKDAETILGKYSFEINTTEAENYFKVASDAISKVIIYPQDLKIARPAGEFSLNKYMSGINVQYGTNIQMYKNLAASIYGATQNARFKDSDIRIIPDTTQIKFKEYTGTNEVNGNIQNLKFKNPTDNIIILFAEVENKTFKVYIIGKK